MGFRKPDLNLAQQAIRKSLGEIHSPYNDGYVQSSCKQELYQLKCWLDDEYRRLPVFADEDAWEQERVIQILKQP
jgi:hypothetical protein